MSRSSPLWGKVSVRGDGLVLAGIIILLIVYLFVPFAICQFFCLFFLFIIAGSRLYSEYLIRKIKIIRRDSELRVFRYEWVRVEIKIENRGFLPAFMTAVSDSTGMLPLSRGHRMLCTLSQRSWTLLVWEGHCTSRGEFSIGPAIVEGSDPLGLFPFELTARETTRLFVYPVSRSISLKAFGGIPLGKIISANPLYEDITYQRSLRPYQNGDEMRRINWKACARASGIITHDAIGASSLMVNEYEATASYPVMIFLNVDRNDYPLKQEWVFIERAIEAAAALCLKASQERQELGIIIYRSNEEDGCAAIAPSAFTLVPILMRLAVLDWTKTEHIPKEGEIPKSAGTMLEKGKHLPYGTRFVYVGPDLGDEAYISLNSLRKHHISLEYLIIDQRSLPFIVPGNSPRYQMKESGYEIV